MIAVAGDTPLMIVDSSGKVVEWSHRAEELLGRPADEVIGRPVTDLLGSAPPTGGEDVDYPRQVDPRDVASGPAGEGLHIQPLPRHDGSVVWKIFLPLANGTLPAPIKAAVLEALHVYAPGPLFVIDGELRVMSANAAAQHMCGTDLQEVKGRSLTAVWSLSAPADVERILRQVLASGAPVPVQVVPARPKNDLQRTHLAISAFPLRDRLGAVVMAADVTDQEKSRRRQRTMRAVRERVGRTLDVVTTCQELVEALVPGFADVAVVEVVEPVVRGEKPPLSPLGRDVPLRRAAFAHSGGERQTRAHPVGDVRALFFPTPYTQVLVDLKPRAVVLGPDTPWLAADPARGRAILESGVRALLTAPLTLRGTVLGLLSLYRVRQADIFDDRDVALILELATHTALSIDNARRYTHEHTIAAALQRHMLAPVPASQTAVETAHLNVPDDQGGGGWFDVFGLPGARTALVVGQVAGHGIQTATTMGQLRTVMHSLAALDLEPDELLARLDDTVTRLVWERKALPADDPLRRQPLSATCLCVMYDPFSRTCAIASAGHPPPMLAGPEETPSVLDLAVGAALGGGSGPPFSTTTVPVADGDVLALYTAPLSAADRPEDGTGGPRLLPRVLADVDRPVQDLCDDVLYRLRADTLSGDAILLLARTHAFPADRAAAWPLDDDATAPAIARRHARSQLATWGVDEDTAYATEEIVSELVTNALRYGAPPVRLRLIKDRTLTCEVHDSSHTAPRLRHAGIVDEGGRGLFICAQLAQNWGIRYNGQGKTVWTEQPLPQRPE
ncbi:hypothetical protein SANT12839_075070 [Streptomyces antimycoticus]|uniref:PAS domain-containing protein n=1 Tax=Streptomyces antimycoticus TaxID=68175 RepID=A0A4D4KCD2_9ACTN|nr:hypothetical protein SANT12839_075070 [Streptomyces antimycoticus]